MFVQIESSRLYQIHPVRQTHIRKRRILSFCRLRQSRQAAVRRRQDDDVTRRLRQINDTFVVYKASGLGGEQMH